MNIFEKMFGKKEEKEEVAEVANQEVTENNESWKTNTLMEIVKRHPDLEGMDYESAWNENLRRDLVQKHNLPAETPLDDAKQADFEKQA